MCVRLIYCCLSLIYHGNWRFRLCASPCPRFITGGDTHSLCVACLGAEHARSALEGAHCVRMSTRSLRSRRALFEEGALTSVPRGSGPTFAKAERRLKSRGSQVDLTERLETGMSFSPSSPARSRAQSVGLEARFIRPEREHGARVIFL